MLFAHLRLFGEKARQSRANLLGLFGRPFAQSLACLHAELASLDPIAQQRVRTRGPVEIGIKHFRDVEREIEANEIGLLHGAEHGGARSETFAHNDIDRLGIANTCGNERDSLALHRVLKPVPDEPGNIPLHMDRCFPDLAQQVHGPRYDVAAGLFVLHDFDQRHQMRRVPEMGADHALAMNKLPPDLGRWNRRTVAGENCSRCDGALELGEDFLFKRQFFRRGLEDKCRIRIAGTSASWASMRRSSPGSSSSNSTIDCRRRGIDDRTSGDGSKTPTRCPAAAKR